MVDLNEHIKLESAEYEAIAADLQGGIVRAHRRKHADHILMSFTSSTAGRSFIQQVIAGRVTSASDQDADEELKTSFLSFALSAQGFRALKKMLPNSGSAFAVGMRQRSDRLHDPADGWQPSLERRWHAIAILADDDSAKLDAERKLLEEAMDSHDVEFVVERGQTLLDASTEHFGFVDGISQPILVSRTDSDSGAVWDRFFPLKQALVVDRAGSHGPDSLGSYLVFRKLEQNFDEFDAQFPGDSDQKLQQALGRSRAGQPLVPDTVSPGADKNDFDFRDDEKGALCPLRSHIRKANPRTSETRDTLFVRRGIPYGIEDTADERGLLFLAFNSSLERQFETMQGDWINGNDFPEKAAGTDALLTSGLVTMRGGEYFFMPSISALKNINDSVPATPAQ